MWIIWQYSVAETNCGRTAKDAKGEGMTVNVIRFPDSLIPGTMEVKGDEDYLIPIQGMKNWYSLRLGQADRRETIHVQEIIDHCKEFLLNSSLPKKVTFVEGLGGIMKICAIEHFLKEVRSQKIPHKV
jgi:hypothetical protein